MELSQIIGMRRLPLRITTVMKVNEFVCLAGAIGAPDPAPSMELFSNDSNRCNRGTVRCHAFVIKLAHCAARFLLILPRFGREQSYQFDMPGQVEIHPRRWYKKSCPPSKTVNVQEGGNFFPLP